MSASETDRRATDMASSMWARVMFGTGSKSASSLMSPLSFIFSYWISFAIDSLMAILTARCAIPAKSAPEKPCVLCAIFSSVMSAAKGDLRNAAFRMLILDFRSGKGM
eukprot:gene6840-biopygen6804